MNQNKITTVTLEDGTVMGVLYENITNDEECFTITGRLVPLPNGQPNEETSEEKEKPYLRRYHFRSALIRFLHKGRLQTAAITHCTDKAWRIINLDLGATWIPKNIIKWSEIAQQFCIVDETYQMNFTLNLTRFGWEYPSMFNSDELIYHEYD